MESYLQQFEGTSLIKRGSIKIELVFRLIKYTNLQNVFFNKITIDPLLTR